MRHAIYSGLLTVALSVMQARGHNVGLVVKPGPSDEDQLEDLKAAVSQLRDNSKAQCEEILREHEAQIEGLEAEHKAQIDAWNSQDKEFHARMKALVDDYRDRSKQIPEKDQKKLNEELKAKVNALRAELHANNKQAVDQARKAQEEMVQVRHDEIEALIDARKAEFKSLRKEFERQRAQTSGPGKGPE